MALQTPKPLLPTCLAEDGAVPIHGWRHGQPCLISAPSDSVSGSSWGPCCPLRGQVNLDAHPSHPQQRGNQEERSRRETSGSHPSRQLSAGDPHSNRPLPGAPPATSLPQEELPLGSHSTRPCLVGHANIDVPPSAAQPCRRHSQRSSSPPRPLELSQGVFRGCWPPLTLTSTLLTTASHVLDTWATIFQFLEFYLNVDH